MTVCIDLTSLADNFSGIERYALSMTQVLINNSNIEYILIFKDKVYEFFDSCAYSNVKKVIIKGGNKLFFNQLKLPTALSRIRADKYLFLAFPAPFFFSGKKTISMIPDLGMWDCPQTMKKHMVIYFKTMYRKVSRGRKKIITISEFTKRRIVDILHAQNENITVAYCGLPNTFRCFKYDYTKELAVKDKYKLPKKYILCLSTVEPRKNMSLLIAAYTDLFIEQKIDIDLVLAGRKGWLVDHLLERVPENVLPHIHFTGFIEEEYLPYIYKASSIFVFPSIYEGFGIPPIEAMSCGTVVVSSDAASLPEVCGDAALYFRSNDVNDLKNTVITALSMEENDLNNIREKAKMHANSYNWSTESTKIMELLS